MTDEDWLQLEDPAEQRAERGPALVIPPNMGPSELAVAERMHRVVDEAANCVLFTVVDDGAGKEIWAPRARGDKFDEAQRWQGIMRWPRIPTIEEAEQFKANAIGVRLARWWTRLAAARELDEKLGYDGLGDGEPPNGSKP